MGYRMNGFSGFGNSPAKAHKPGHKKQVPLSKHEDKKGTMITGGSKSEEINDLEDRIEFLNSDISDSESIMKKGKMITQRNKLKTRLNKDSKRK